MSVAAMVGILVALVVAGGVTAFFVAQHRRTAALRERYGPEYTRTLREAGSQHAGESELLKRQERVEHLEIRPLHAQQRAEFLQRWRNVQTAFVDDPSEAISRADGLVEEVMKTRGYPIADFDSRAADLSVYHASVVDNYRGARDIALRHRRGVATTEDLRKAMVYYRALFQDLLEDRENAAEAAAERVVERERAVERPVERAVERDVARAADAPPRVIDDEHRSIAPTTPPAPRTDRNIRP